MRLTCMQRWILCVSISFICLSLPYIIMSNIDQEGTDVPFHKRLRGQEWMKTNRAEDIMKTIIKFVDELLNLVTPSKASAPPLYLKDYKEELKLLQIKVEADEEKGKMREEMIKELQSDKLRLQQQVSRLEEDKKLQTQKEEDKVQQAKSVSPPLYLKNYKEELKLLQIKMESEGVKGKMREEMIKELQSDKRNLQQQVSHLEDIIMLQAQKEKSEEKDNSDDKNCPLPPMNGYPHCQGKLKWMKEMWRSDPYYSNHGVNGSLCSFLIFLSEVEYFCPLLPGRKMLSELKIQVESVPAVMRESLADLYPPLQSRNQFKWIHQRVHSMEEIWVEAGRSLSVKYNLTERKAKHILVHPGAVTDESGFGIARDSFRGGPLGELVQWSDLISTLHVLGHHLHLSASIPDLKTFFWHSPVEVNLIYTDIIGLKQIKDVLQDSWTKYKCMVRVLDSFGTEPDFNHEIWAKNHNQISSFGSLNLIPMQFNTMFPHTPDNTFLGFVVQHNLSADEIKRLNSTRRRKQALVYGKRASFWQGKNNYIDVINKYLEVHGTVDNNNQIPTYVKNHGIVNGSQVQILLRQSKVFVGLSFPYEGPAPLEAISNGCAFLNPRLNPPLSRLNSDFFKDKPNIREVTSQNPYAESLGEPHVWTIDMHNVTEVERALNAILNQTLEPYLPYEFSCEGMLQRVNILVNKQDFCSSAGSWPPLSVLQVVEAEVKTSCKQACQKKGLICEPAFFPRLNSNENVARYGIDCRTSELSDSQLVFPAYNSSSKHCIFQSDPLLFSCVRSNPSLTRVCPCRDYIKDQIALCKACI